MVLGIDIYERYQDVSDWGAVARHGVTFAWIKASDGGSTFRTDPARRPDALIAGATRAGIKVGLYHYAQFSPSAEAQADVLMAEVRRLGATGLPPALDLEAPFVPGSGARDFAIRFLRRLVDHHKVRPAIYGNTSMLSRIRPDTMDIPGLVIWAADYGVNDGSRNPDLRPYRGRVDVHQYTSAGRVPGIAGTVDLNHFLTTFYGPQEDDMADLQNEIVSTYKALYYRHDPVTKQLVMEHANPGDQSIITRLAEIQRNTRLVPQIVAAVTNDPDITPEQVAAILDAAVAEHTPTAEQIAAAIDVAQRPHIEAAVRAVLGEDHADQAAAIVDELVARLSHPVPEGN